MVYRVITLVVALLLPAPVVSEGRCAGSYKNCVLEKPLPKAAWWERELRERQPECNKIDPGGSGTCHQWTVDLSDKAQEAVLDVKTQLSDYIKTRYDTTAKSRILSWNNPMDELYLSAPGNTEGSDRVFVTPHIDGPHGIYPFMTNFRCVYGLTGPHETVTIQPMRDLDERELTLGPGIFTCFDFNREIHWIEKRGEENSTSSERMVLKLHFYEYPAILAPIADYFGSFNANYNFAARAAFLASQFPDRSKLSRLLARLINGWTIAFGLIENVFGYMNIGVVLLFAYGLRMQLYSVVKTVSVLHLVISALTLVFRSLPHGQFVRDAVGFQALSFFLLSIAYLKELSNGKFDGRSMVSIILTGAGFSLVGSVISILGPHLMYYGDFLSSWPVSESLDFTPLQYSLAMKAGWMIGLLGMSIGAAKFSSIFNIHLILNMMVAGLEITGLHLPSSLAYDKVIADFEACHADQANIYAHLATTGVAILGVFGMLSLMTRKSNQGTKSPTNYLPSILTAVSWVLVRYTVPDDDVAFLTVGVTFALAATAWHLNLSLSKSVVLLLAGMVGQEIAHMVAKETAYMWTYLAEQEAPMAAATFALHNVWLVPFELRSFVTVISASAMKSAMV